MDDGRRSSIARQMAACFYRATPHRPLGMRDRGQRSCPCADFPGSQERIRLGGCINEEANRHRTDPLATVEQEWA